MLVFFKLPCNKLLVIVSRDQGLRLVLATPFFGAEPPGLLAWGLWASHVDLEILLLHLIEFLVLLMLLLFVCEVLFKFGFVELLPRRVVLRG